MSFILFSASAWIIIIGVILIVIDPDLTLLSRLFIDYVK